MRVDAILSGTYGPLSPLTRADVQAWALEEVLARRGTARIRVRGTSMMPLVFPRAVLPVEGCDSRSVREGDVVVVVRDGSLVVHRAVQRHPVVGWVTRGDANDGEDPVREDARIVARVVGIAAGSRARRLPVPVEALCRRAAARHVAHLGRSYRFAVSRWQAVRRLLASHDV